MPKEMKAMNFGRIGSSLRGVAVGVVAAKFVLWCRINGYVPVFNCRGVCSISSEVLESMKTYFDDMISSCGGDPVRVRLVADDKFRDSAEMKKICEHMSV